MEHTDAIVIRPAAPADLPAVGRMGEALCRSHHELDPERFFVWDDMASGYTWWLGQELANKDVVLFVAEDEGRIVGYAYGRMEEREWNSLRDACGVGIDLFVDPEARMRGVGRRLCEEFMRALQSRGAPRIIIQAAARNEGAVAFYRSLGFRPTMIEMARELT
jgi:ribosomal protein S18 acetylase RimI-like enzyme